MFYDHLSAHSLWLNWVDVDDDEDEVVLKYIYIMKLKIINRQGII